MVNLLGAQSDLNIDNTATGSVADIRTQNNKHTRNGICIHTNGNAKYKTEATNPHDISSQKTASDDIVFQLLNNCL
jgi:hypothetical protein